MCFLFFKVKFSKPFYISTSAAVFKLSCMESEWREPEERKAKQGSRAIHPASILAVLLYLISYIYIEILSKHYVKQA